MNKRTIQITEAALMKRVNRVLAPKGEHVRKWRGGAEAFLHVAHREEAILTTFNDLEDFARHLGVLAGWESKERV